MAELSNLGRYQLRRVLGKGAMGVVYDAYDPTINRRVAIKVILKSHAIDEAMARDYSARFVREAQAAGRISHPNIVQVHDFGEQEDIAYLVLEFIEGRDLRSFFSAKEAFEIKESVRIMGELLDALDFAHEAGVIHRDVKPANVMLDSQRRVKLADFGVARIEDAARTGADTMVGTPAFMSPEQISGKKIDHRTDIFSAGSILYQLLTGEQPFKGQGAWTVAKQIMQDDPPPPSSVIVSVTPAFDGIVSKALAKDPVQRFANAREFAEALRAAFDDRTQVRAPASAAAPGAPKQGTQPDFKGSEIEIGFWRSIQDADDLAELELYLEQFPDGIYAKLARHKIAKLRATALPKGVDDSGSSAKQAQEERARKEAEEQAKQEAAESARREAIEQAKREAEAKAKLEAEERRRKDAEQEARAEAEAKLKAEFEAALAKRDAEFQKRAAEAEAKRQEEEKAKLVAEAKKKAEFEAAVAKREAELKKREADVGQGGGRRKIAPVMIAGIAAAVVAIGVGVYFGLKPDTSAREAELLKMLEEAKKTNAELLQAKQRETELQKAVEQAREREDAAKASGDVAKQRELAEQTRQREAEAQKQAELIKKREAEAQKQAELNKQRQEELTKLAEARKAEEAKKQADAAKRAAEKAAAEKVAADMAAAQKEAAEKLISDKAASAKAAAGKLAADKAAGEKAAADKVALAKAAIAAAAPSMQKAGAQSWHYVKYNLGALGGLYNDRQVVRGYITFEDKGGKTILRPQLTTIDLCYMGDLDATVIRTEATTTITAVRDLRGCEAMRFVIKNDGTGGQQQIKSGSNWVSDGLDHGLTPRK